MKLWTKTTIDQLIETFTVGQDRVLDLELAKYDVLGSIAHAKMLASTGLISTDDQVQLEKALKALLIKVHAGVFEIEEGQEDVHSQVEKILVEQIGDAGKRLHTGRSRNDQVLLDLRLYFRERLDDLGVKVKQLVHAFAEKSEATKMHLMPGYTHMQVGMVSSFGLWFGSFLEALIDDLKQLQHTRTLINQNPLGSAAGYGSSFPLDRRLTTELLDFDDLCYNAMYAQFGRGKTELLIAQSLGSLCYTLSKFAMDVCLFSNQNYDLIQLPDEIVTGSSIMPHKRNPDVFELIRARSNQLMSLPTQILMICQNLPSGYHRDFQQVKEVLFPAFGNLHQILDILLHVLPKMKVAPNALDDSKYDLLFSVDAINQLVTQGVPFRDAYHQVKKQIQEGTFIPDKSIQHTHLGSIGNLATKEILSKI